MNSLLLKLKIGALSLPQIIPAATENDSCIRWYKGRDCGPRSEQGIAAKAAPVVNEGPAGAVRQGRTGVRHKTAKKVSTFFAVGIRLKSYVPIRVSARPNKTGLCAVRLTPPQDADDRTGELRTVACYGHCRQD